MIYNFLFKAKREVERWKGLESNFKALKSEGTDASDGLIKSKGVEEVIIEVYRI